MKSSGSRVWIGFLACLFAAFAALLGWSFWRAAVGGSPVSDPSYYVRGFHHDEEARAEQVARDEGWDLSVALAGRTITVRLRDRRGEPLRGAQVKVSLASHQGEGAVTLQLGEGPEGQYATVEGQ